MTPANLIRMNNRSSSEHNKNINLFEKPDILNILAQIFILVIRGLNY